MNHTQYLDFATAGLPQGIDYLKYLGAPNHANQYSERDAFNARAMCKTVARVLLVS